MSTGLPSREDVPITPVVRSRFHVIEHILGRRPWRGNALALIRQEAGGWSLKGESFNAPLRRGLQMKLEASAIRYTVTALLQRSSLNRGGHVFALEYVKRVVD